MAYLVRGKAAVILSTLGLADYSKSTTDFHELKAELRDIPFLGDSEQRDYFAARWQQVDVASYHRSNNCITQILKKFLWSSCFETTEHLNDTDLDDFIEYRFAYLDDLHNPCTISFIQVKNRSDCWCICIIKKAHTSPAEQEVVVILSHENAFLTKENLKNITISYQKSYQKCMQQELNSVNMAKIFSAALGDSKHLIGPYFKRINYLVCSVVGENTHGTIDEPDLSVPMDALFAENKVLELLIAYNVPISFSLIKDCLTETGTIQLKEKLTFYLSLTKNEVLKPIIASLVVSFYQSGNLDEYDALLKDHVTIEQYASFFKSMEQIQLFVSLGRLQCSKQVNDTVLSNADFYKPLYLISELNLLQFAKPLLNDLSPLEQLKTINRLTNSASKKLCLIFWAYQILDNKLIELISVNTKKYPLMASTLIEQYMRCPVFNQIFELKSAISDPKKHLTQTIKYHYFERMFSNYGSSQIINLEQFDTSILEQTAKALAVLKKNKIDDLNKYLQVLDNTVTGISLRLLLPIIGQYQNYPLQKSLIDTLFEGIHSSVVNLELISNTVLTVDKEIQCRLFCIQQLYKLQCEDVLLKWIAETENQHAASLRQIIMISENQCKKISEHIAGSTNEHKRKEWDDHQNNYRKKLYRICFETLNSSKSKDTRLAEAKEAIKHEEKKMLSFLDPEIVRPYLHQWVRNTFLLIINFLISVLTVGIANYLHYQKTGHYWFFTCSKSAEVLCEINTKAEKLLIFGCT